MKAQYMSAPLATTIDLRQIEPFARHTLIFSSYAALLPGQALEIINDHDPAPLNAQFQVRSPGMFSWNYVEEGPQVWRVQIGKTADAASAASSSCCSGGACCG